MEKSLKQLEVPLPSGQESTTTDQESCNDFEWTEAEEKIVLRKYEAFFMEVKFQKLTKLQNRLARDASVDSCLHGSPT